MPQSESNRSDSASPWAASCLCGCGGKVRAKGSIFIRGHQARIFRADEDDRLRREYLIYRDAGNLQDLADSMGRTKQLLCRRARSLGLTDQKRPKPYAATWKYMSEAAARVVWEHFKASSLGLGKFCRTHGYDDLGFSRTMRKYFADEYDAAIELKVPLTSLYRTGRALEYRVRDQLRAGGFFVMRSPASRSPIDLVAIRPGLVIFVQCKRGGALGVVEWNEFYDLCLSTGAEPILASQPTSRGTSYQKLVGRKDGSRRAQPFVPWAIPMSPQSALQTALDETATP